MMQLIYCMHLPFFRRSVRDVAAAVQKLSSELGTSVNESRLAFDRLNASLFQVAQNVKDNVKGNEVVELKSSVADVNDKLEKFSSATTHALSNHTLGLTRVITFLVNMNKELQAKIASEFQISIPACISICRGTSARTENRQ